jgi:hypothetical protein
MQETKYEELNRRLDRLEKVLESERTDELFGGLIGKVNATKKDNDEIIKTIKGVRGKLGGKYPMDVKPTAIGFGIYCSFTVDGDFYNLVIGERAKDKIVVELYKDGSKFPKAKVKGLTLNAKKIRDAAIALLEKNFSKDELESMEKASVTASELYDKQERERQAERDRMYAAKKSSKKDDDEKSYKIGGSKKTQYSRQDWVDINPQGNPWIIDPGRL